MKNDNLALQNFVPAPVTRFGTLVNFGLGSGRVLGMRPRLDNGVRKTRAVFLDIFTRLFCVILVQSAPRCAQGFVGAARIISQCRRNLLDKDLQGRNDVAAMTGSGRPGSVPV